ncbi:MAG: C1 family peptidase [Microscillaceae bacterium]|nr:C1 family peptidase [Microscillaceae bacterium]
MKKNILFALVLCFISSSLIGLTPIQAQNFGTGCVLNPSLYEQIPLAATLMRGDFQKLPTSVSLRPYAPIPQNQGSYGTCVGWSTAYAARTILMAYHQNWTNSTLITENAFSPYFIYEQAKSVNDVYCQEGTSLFNALEIIKEVGVVKVSDFGSQCGQTITPILEAKAQKFKIKEYRRLFETGSSGKTLLVKKSLAENRPVIIGMQCCTKSFLNAKGKDFWSILPGENANPEGGHALTVVGYDDNKYGGAFELMNSWGTAWGNEGFIYLSYDDFEKYCFEAYEMILDDFGSQNLAGEIRFELSSGMEMKTFYKGRGSYETISPYHSGTLFRLYISNQDPAYVYAFNSDLSRKNYKIFPHKPSVSAFLGYKGNNIAIPDEFNLIQMDANPGVDFFCILYSKEKLDIDRILADIEQTNGEFQERIYRVLSDKLFAPHEVSFDIDGKISFRALSTEKSIVPVIVSMPHIK